MGFMERTTEVQNTSMASFISNMDLLKQEKRRHRTAQSAFEAWGSTPWPLEHLDEAVRNNRHGFVVALQLRVDGLVAEQLLLHAGGYERLAVALKGKGCAAAAAVRAGGCD